MSGRDVTQLLEQYGRGDARAGDELLRLLYRELHGVAGALMRGQRPDHTLQPTALVSEACLRLLARDGSEWRDREWRDREQFLAFAARAMRSALVDHARARQARKRGAGAERLPLHGLRVSFEDRALELVELDDALDQLAAESERAARVVELRFFGGLTAEETARVLETSLRTVERDWRAARAWLSGRLSDAGEEPA